MKTIKGLNEKLTDFRGNTVKERDENGEVVEITRKDQLLNFAGGCKASSGKESIRLVNLGAKLLNVTEDSVELEDSDYSLLKSIVDKNETGYPAFVQGAVAQLFED